ncbi:magnesium-dependent phosphatase-1 [Stieleria sp. TO1_6]|uniref:magnesium-dependent phosphatase-1 n=1 Tax=Stieleria tagensis TaxID=2956795 RepID=UPI00209A700F|nr:magnesium-dependent phosphatase-1 [Stieleria tagensis]MCO8122560.1 magnesium-dependent phosphatase-1 [Stieleria tagensis]
MRKPELIVFDLDFTLWDCDGTWCDCLSPPFRRQNERVLDRASRQVRLYDDVTSILDHCDNHSIPMAIASRTEQPAWARELVGLLAINHRFAFAEIYPSSKLKHFASLSAASGLNHEGMIFFDDEMRNINEVSTLGVTSIHVPNGMTADLFHTTLRAFENSGHASRHQD